MKTCRKCGCEKPLDGFYTKSKATGARQAQCKTCTKARSNKYRAENLEQVKEYDRQRGALPHRVAARAAYAKTASGKYVGNKAKQSWIERNPIKNGASTMVSNAVRDGKITKSPCEICGSTYRVHGHHDDYAFPLTVRWLCPQHHTQWHKENGPGLNGDG